MNQIKETIEEAAERAGGVRALARLLDWDAGSIVKARDGEKISPYRSAQLAAYLGEDVERAIVAALLDTAKSSSEVDFWRGHLRQSRGRLVDVAGDVLKFLEERWATYAHQPSPERKSATFASVFKERLDSGLAKHKIAQPIRKAG